VDGSGWGSGPGGPPGHLNGDSTPCTWKVLNTPGARDQVAAEGVAPWTPPGKSWVRWYRPRDPMRMLRVRKRQPAALGLPRTAL
jgi:hypothetical protein